MEQQGLVRFEKKGRLKIVQLTGKGEKVANKFEDLGKLLM
jgi:predicted transcriptional regulator